MALLNLSVTNVVGEEGFFKRDIFLSRDSRGGYDRCYLIVTHLSVEVAEIVAKIYRDVTVDARAINGAAARALLNGRADISLNISLSQIGRMSNRLEPAVYQSIAQSAKLRELSVDTIVSGQPLIPFVSPPNLIKVSIPAIPMTQEAARILAIKPSLKEASFTGGYLDDAIVEVLRASKSLTSLRCGPLSDKGAVKFASMPNLNKLSCTLMRVTVEMAQAVKENASLTSLQLDEWANPDSPWRDSGVARLLSVAPFLKTLFLNPLLPLEITELCKSTSLTGFTFGCEYLNQSMAVISANRTITALNIASASTLDLRVVLGMGSLVNLSARCSVEGIDGESAFRQSHLEELTLRLIGRRGNEKKLEGVITSIGKICSLRKLFLSVKGEMGAISEETFYPLAFHSSLRHLVILSPQLVPPSIVTLFNSNVNLLSCFVTSQEGLEQEESWRQWVPLMKRHHKYLNAWQMVTALLAFQRANETNFFKDSILQMINPGGELCRFLDGLSVSEIEVTMKLLEEMEVLAARHI